MVRFHPTLGTPEGPFDPWEELTLYFTDAKTKPTVTTGVGEAEEPLADVDSVFTMASVSTTFSREVGGLAPADWSRTMVTVEK